MKSRFYKLAVLACLLSPAVSGMSLYDMAPPIGIPETYALRYTANVGVGYDDNVNSSSINKTGSVVLRAGLGASGADNESVDKVSYNAHVGASWYAKKANSSDANWFSDTSLGASLSHAFGGGSVYSTNISLGYKPEPDYSNGISAARSQGDCFNWSWTNSYSRPIDSRWAWNASLSTSGNIYSESDYRTDNRQYLSGGLGLSYKSGDRVTYGLNASYKYDFREYGYDSDNVYLTLSVNRSIDAISSCSLSLGTQMKRVDGNDASWYPTVRAAYNRSLAEGLSCSLYVSLDNENIDTYSRTANANYFSDLTWRVGANFTYRLSPLVSFYTGGSLISQNYSRGTNGLQNRDCVTWQAHVGMGYVFTESLRGDLRYGFTQANRDGGDYDRQTVDCSLVYTF